MEAYEKLNHSKWESWSSSEVRHQNPKQRRIPSFLVPDKRCSNCDTFSRGDATDARDPAPIASLRTERPQK